MSSAHFNWIIWCWGVELQCSLYVLDTNLLSDMSFANIYSHSVGCLLVLLIVSFTVQKLFLLMKSQQFFCLLVFVFVFLFAIVSLALEDICRKKLLWMMSKRFLTVFSCRTFMVSGLTFRSLIHFEFIFVYHVRMWSSFILLHVAVQFPTLFVKETVFFFPLDIQSCFVED